MAKISIVPPGDDKFKLVECEINTMANDVEIREAFNGIVFITKEGERLAVSMRDSGFEVHYFHDHPQLWDSGWFEFKSGKVQRMVEVT